MAAPAVVARTAGQAVMATATGMVAIKNGKIAFKEKREDFASHHATIAELSRFHEFHQKLTVPLDEFPADFSPLLAKLVQEKDVGLLALAKQVKKALCPKHDDQEHECLSQKILEAAVKDIAARTNYGLAVESAPSHVSIWRWEVENMKLLGEDIGAKVEERRAHRKQAAAELQKLYAAMTETEQSSLLSKGRKSLRPEASPQTAVLPPASPATPFQSVKSLAPSDTPTSKKQLKTSASMSTPGAKKAAGPVQKSLATFFSKVAKPSAPTAAEEGDPELQDYLDRFPKFYVRTNTVVAKENRFFRVLTEDLSAQIARQNAGDDGVGGRDGEYSAAELAFQFDRFRRKRRRGKSLSKQFAAPAVQPSPDLLADEEAVRRKVFQSKWKLLSFHENVRPPYYGTWQKVSACVSGRRPFALESEHLNYDVDSDAEWEEGEAEVGGEVEELESEDEEADGDESDADMDDWLVEEDAEKPVSEIVQPPGVKSTKKKGTRLVPYSFGVWVASVSPDEPPAGLAAFAALCTSDLPVDPFKESVDATTAAASLGAAGKAKPKPPAASLDEAQLKILVDSVVGKTAAMQKLVDSVKQSLPTVSKLQLEAKIKEIAVKVKRDGDEKPTWYLREESETAPAPQTPAKRKFTALTPG
ncbi:chromatin assembly factor 1 subunit A-domain-containing protein [Zopfochytrium polystomum]|nr:chromatin assembly factor 1 subunit A-domain-containing protein [Zopfochytrium polystomum]